MYIFTFNFNVYFNRKLIDGELMDDPIKDIYRHIDAYIRIVQKTLHDMVPKAITHYIIHDLFKFINEDLFKPIYQSSKEEYVSISINQSIKRKHVKMFVYKFFRRNGLDQLQKKIKHLIQGKICTRRLKEELKLSVRITQMQ